ncbi:MAG: AAA family ATPase [Rhodospirillales bacterium]|nr:AAA family ATPase [Rhodospirillales bacterium]
MADVVGVGDILLDAEAISGGVAPSTIWQELEAWGVALPDWQRFVVSHAVRDGELSEDRIGEAYRLFLREAKLDKGTEELPVIPSSVTGRANSITIGALQLKEMKALKGVNAIPETSGLTFGPGLTVIYGHNGAGKSGFARALSAVCFSRSNQNIFGNVYDTTPTHSPASVEIVLDRGGSAETVRFVFGDENDDLQRISVFDSSSARIHLAQENTLGFQPVGFDVFDEMGRVIGLIGKKLDAAIEALTKPNDFGKLFIEPGPVAEEIAQLSAETEIAPLRARGTFGKAELERLEEVARQEKETSAKSSAEAMKALSAAKADITSIQTRIADLLPKISEEACKSGLGLLAEQAATTVKAVEAGAEAVKHPDLKQTGTDKWDAFVEASRDLGLAEKEAYPQSGEPCLLCHRPLDEPSATLIRRMWAFLDDVARQAMLAVDDQINARIKSLRELDLTLLPPESRIRSDLSKIDPGLVAALDEVSEALIKRRDEIVSALDTNSAGSMPKGEILPPTKLLSDAVAKIDEQKKALRAGKFDEVLAKLKAEHIELRQRQVLSKNIEDVVSYVENLKWLKAANAKKRSGLSTRFLTDKQRSLFQTHIEGAYRERLDHECGLLDCSFPYELKTRGSAGQTLRGLRVQGGHRPEDIFSEGEQRALALADFLTEVNLNPASAAVILDDPVTSMDHQRKRKIAIRLADEATRRQVIVFTHDLVFLTLLADHAENAAIPLERHWVERLDGVPGHVNIGDIPANTREYRKTTKAREFLAKAKKASGSEKVDHIRSGAGALRRTLEVVVIQYLFKDVVQRWDEQVHLGALNKIEWSNELADEIVALQDDTSRLLEGHSNSDEFAGGMPEVDSLEKLIDRVDAVIEKAKQERQ